MGINMENMLKSRASVGVTDTWRLRMEGFDSCHQHHQQEKSKLCSGGIRSWEHLPVICESLSGFQQKQCIK